MIMTEQVKDAVHYKELNLGLQPMTGCAGLGASLRHGDDHIPKVGQTRVWIGLTRREAQHIRGSINPEVLAIQLAHLGIVAQEDGQVTGHSLAREGLYCRVLDQRGCHRHRLEL
jgi:hypothetical protein